MLTLSFPFQLNFIMDIFVFSFVSENFANKIKRNVYWIVLSTCHFHFCFAFTWLVVNKIYITRSIQMQCSIINKTEGIEFVRQLLDKNEFKTRNKIKKTLINELDNYIQQPFRSVLGTLFLSLFYCKPLLCFGLIYLVLCTNCIALRL